MTAPLKTYSVQIIRRRIRKGQPLDVTSSRRARTPTAAAMKALRRADADGELEGREALTLHVECTDQP